MTFNPLDAKTWHDDPKDAVIPPHELRWHDAALDDLLHNRTMSEARVLKIGDSVTVSRKSSRFLGYFGTVLFLHEDGALVRLTMEDGDPLCDELYFHFAELTRRDVLALPPGPCADLSPEEEAAHQAYEYAFDAAMRNMRRLGEETGFLARDEAAEGKFKAFLQRVDEARARRGPQSFMEDEAIIEEAETWADRILEDVISDPPDTS